MTMLGSIITTTWLLSLVLVGLVCYSMGVNRESQLEVKAPPADQVHRIVVENCVRCHLKEEIVR